MRRPFIPLYLLILSLALLMISFPHRQRGNPSGTGERHDFSRYDLAHGHKYVPDEVLVRFKPGTVRRAMMSAHARVSGTITKEFKIAEGLHLVKLSAETSLKRALLTYRKDPNVLYAEPNYRLRPLALPSDPLFPQQWALSNSGQDGGVAGADIHAQQAWDITTGSPNVVVAVIDSGIDYNHPDLAPNVWSSPSPFSQTINGVNISCAAGTHGFDALTASCDPMDNLGHGTHVAGIIGAAGNNALGVTGVNWNVKLLACKFIAGDGTASVAGAVTCLDYVKAVKDSGVSIVATNNSYGGNFLSQALMDAIAALQQDGILFIAAAGNDFQDNDLVPTYPANLYLPHLVSVGATNRSDGVPAFSNLGAHTVHLGAPGQDILSTLPGGTYGFETGTSMSAPLVVGVAALLAAADPNRDWRAIRNQLLAGGDTVPALANTVTGKRLNAYGALACSNSTLSSRLQPTMLNTAGAVGSPVTLAYLNINCAQPNGPVDVQISPSGETITLKDDGTGGDLAAGDGIYSGLWTPQALGSYTATFQSGGAVNVQVLDSYLATPVSPADYKYRNISGTNLNLGDDSVAKIASPFPIQFGGGSFNDLYVSSNGTISFTDVVGGFVDVYLPRNADYQAYESITTLVAPFWEDLYPVSGTDNNVFWDVIGTAPNRELVIEWRNVETYECRGDGSATVKFQVVFREASNDVLFNYADTTFGGSCSDEDLGAMAEVGIQVAPTQATTWSFDQPDVGDGTGIAWTLATGTPLPNPVPAISSVSPSTVQAGGPDFVLTVTGSNFVPQSVVESDSHACPTAFIDTTKLQAVIPAADIRYNGSDTIDVYNPAPGGGTSDYVNVKITGYPAPVITALNPSSAVAGGFSFRLEVDGSGFVFGASVEWNGASVYTLYYGPTKLVGLILGDLIANPGTAQITVNNLNQGGISSAVSFTIAAPTMQSAVVADQTMGRSGPAVNPSLRDVPGAIKSPKFLPRFLGWNMARKEGTDYVRHFLRPHAGTARPIANLKPGNATSGLGPNFLGQALNATALPGFQFRSSIPADFLPTSVATGDFNHDGRMDWVVANGGANSLWIYFGNGDGTARPPVIIPLKGQAPVFVAAADLRGSGALDLIVAEADSGEVGVLLGNADGTFGLETSYFVPGAPLSILIDDFNRDGHKDILVGMGGNVNVGELAFLPGDGTGHFGSPVYRPYEYPFVASEDVLFANNVAEADLDGDGFPDLVVNDINPVRPGVYACLNQKDGTFKVSQPFVDYPGFDRVLITNVALDDVTGDGCADLIDTDSFGIATLFQGNCDGTFQNQSSIRKLGVGDIAGGLTLADVNGDGKLDIVASSAPFLDTRIFGDQPGNVVSVLLGDGHGNFGNAQVFRGQPSMYSLALADLNGDGKLDVVTANQDADSVSVFLNDGTGGFGAPSGVYIGYHAFGNNEAVINAPYSGFKVADINGDGKPDLVLLELGRLYPEPFNLTVLVNKGSGQFSDPVRSAVIDASYKTNGIVSDFALGDFRNTGRPDFVAVGSQFSLGTSYVAFAKNDGDGTFTPLPLTQPPGAQGVIGVGDFNGDGKLDFVTSGSTTGSNPNSTKSILNVFLGNGDGTFVPGYSTTFHDVPGDLFPDRLWVGDFNGDGKPDILVQLRGTTEGTQGHDVYEFLGKGDGTFATGKVVLPDFGAMNVADLNHDGIDDVVEIVEPLTTLAEGIPLQYAVYLGQRDGTFALNNTYQPYAGVLDFGYISYIDGPAVMLADFNGDGNIDIAALQLVPSFSPSAAGPHTYLQVLAGNGDGTFTPTFTTFDFNQFLYPQFASDLNGDGKADLLELAGYSSSFHVVTAESGPALQLNLVSLPVVGSKGSARVTLAVTSATDTTIQLSASDPAISLPASITIPANSLSQDVPFQIQSGFNPNRVFTIQASLGTQTVTAYGWKAGGLQVGFRMTLFGTSTPTIVAGQTTLSYGVSISSINGYSTTLQLSCTGLPSWATCQFGQAAPQLPAGETLTPSLVVNTTSAGVPGTYPLRVVATDGTLTDRVKATLSVGDFGISISPSTLSALTTGSASSNLSVTSVNNYAGYVAMSIAGLPAGATPSLSNTTAGSSGSLVVTTNNTPVGTYPFTVTGVSNGITRSATATLQVGDFGMSIAPSVQTVSSTGSATYTIAATSSNGFAGTVQLGISGLPAGATVGSGGGTIQAGGPSQQLVIQTAGVAAGTYPFTLTGTSGSLTHSATATLQVQGPPDFSGTISPTSATLSVGQSAKFSVALKSQNGATGNVSFQCLNVPSGTSCTFDPASVSLPADGNASDQLTVQVNSRPAVVPPGAPGPPSLPTGDLGTLCLFAAMFIVALARQTEMKRSGRRLAASVVVVIGTASLFLATSCGGGGGSPNLPPPPVTFTITVQASGAGVSTMKALGTLTISVK